ncbi:hypothetical protein ABW636_04155 [Aquimarina sp. 2201CG1-2-11]|uniref:hypothetical protein n=1 Tax=Aquimarina discodermiae TaxID=3231043 RepID=UPI00346372A8
MKNKKITQQIMPIAQDELHYQFCLDILESLHFKRKDFFTKLAEGSPYEMMIYDWMHLMFEQGKTKEEAIDFIYKARYEWYVKKS